MAAGWEGAAVQGWFVQALTAGCEAPGCSGILASQAATGHTAVMALQNTSVPSN